MEKKYGLLYFSGTGNTKALADLIGKKLGLAAHSIEEDLDWKDFFGRPG